MAEQELSRTELAVSFRSATLVHGRRQVRAKSWRGLTIAAVDIQRPCFVVRCGLVRRSVRRTCSGATLNATELGALGCSTDLVDSENRCHLSW